jgi:methionine-gamma-lyase
MSGRRRFRFDTLAVHGGVEVERGARPIEPPIHVSSAFAFASSEQAEEAFAGKNDAWIYGRWGNPTVADLERAIASLEGGGAAVVTPSGMAAVSGVVFTLCGAGDHVVAPRSLYGETARLLRERAPRFGIRTTFVDSADPSAFEAAIEPSTKLVYLETPQNPTLGILDIETICAVAHPRRAVVAVDNTFATPFCQRPLALGADVVIHSMTKALSGHGDVIGGAVACAGSAMRDAIADTIVKGFGGVLAPLAAFLVSRGLKTLSLRMDRACANAATLAQELERNTAVSCVFYPGLPSHPNHAIARKQMTNFGAMVSFDLQHREAAKRFLEHISLMTHAVSLGDVRTLVTHPASTTASTVPPADRARVGITDGLLRLSVGVEDIEDLLEDLRAAIAHATA